MTIVGRPAQETLKRAADAVFVPTLSRFVRALVLLAKEADAVAPDRHDPVAKNRRTIATSSRVFNLIGVCGDAGQQSCVR